jgi:nitrogen fixation/metabolism regulation signal transduction histidine kinase
MKIQFKLILIGFVVIALLMGVIGIVQYRSSLQVSQDIEKVDELFELMVAHDVAELNAVSHIIGALDHTSISIHELILGEEGAKEELEKSIEEFDTFRSELEDALRAAAAADIDKDLKDLAEIEKGHEHLHDDVEKIIALVEKGDLVSATELLHDEIDPELESLHEKIVLFEEDAEREISEIGEEVDSLIHHADAAAAAAAAAARILTIGIVTAILLALGMGIAVSRSIAKPLKELQETAEAVAKGNLSKRAKVRSNDEIGRVAAAFNRMTDFLLEAQNMPKSILQSMRDALFVVDTKGNITEVNQAALKALGYEKEELVGQPLNKVLKAHNVK